MTSLTASGDSPQAAAVSEVPAQLNCTIENTRTLARGLWPLPPSFAHHLLRIAQEAVTNTLKHSGATDVVLELRPAEEGIYLCVRDNGRGFPDAIVTDNGMGLLLMQYRARLLGGDLRAHAAPHQGVTMTCRCPVHSFASHFDLSDSGDLR